MQYRPEERKIIPRIAKIAAFSLKIKFIFIEKLESSGSQLLDYVKLALLIYVSF